MTYMSPRVYAVPTANQSSKIESIESKYDHRSSLCRLCVSCASLLHDETPRPKMYRTLHDASLSLIHV